MDGNDPRTDWRTQLRKDSTACLLKGLVATPTASTFSCDIAYSRSPTPPSASSVWAYARKWVSCAACTVAPSKTSSARDVGVVRESSHAQGAEEETLGYPVV